MRENNLCSKARTKNCAADERSRTIVNRTSDWVYEEEFNLQTLALSPDSRSIAYWQFNTEESATSI